MRSACQLTGARSPPAERGELCDQRDGSVDCRGREGCEIHVLAEWVLVPFLQRCLGTAPRP